MIIKCFYFPRSLVHPSIGEQTIFLLSIQLTIRGHSATNIAPACPAFPEGGRRKCVNWNGARFSAISRYEFIIESQDLSCMFPFPRTPLLVPPGNTQQIFSRPPPAAEFTTAWPLQQASNAALKEIWSGSWSERTKEPTTHRKKRSRASLVHDLDRNRKICGFFKWSTCSAFLGLRLCLNFRKSRK